MARIDNAANRPQPGCPTREGLFSVALDGDTFYGKANEAQFANAFVTTSSTSFDSPFVPATRSSATRIRSCSAG